MSTLAVGSAAVTARPGSGWPRRVAVRGRASRPLIVFLTVDGVNGAWERPCASLRSGVGRLSTRPARPMSSCGRSSPAARASGCPPCASGRRAHRARCRRTEPHAVPPEAGVQPHRSRRSCPSRSTPWALGSSNKTAMTTSIRINTSPAQMLNVTDTRQTRTTASRRLARLVMLTSVRSPRQDRVLRSLGYIGSSFQRLQTPVGERAQRSTGSFSPAEQNALPRNTLGLACRSCNPRIWGTLLPDGAETKRSPCRSDRHRRSRQSYS